MSSFHLSFTDYVLDSVLVLLVLTQIREKPLTTFRVFVLPLIVVGIAVEDYLQQIPTAGHDLLLAIVLAAIGAIIGWASGVTVHMRPRSDGKTLIKAGWVSAFFWVLGMGGRFAFLIWISYGSGVTWVTKFSFHHDITSGAAWTVAVLAEAVLEVVARIVVLAIRSRKVASLKESALAST